MLVHGWDLATAIGIPFPVPAPLVLVALDVAERLVTPAAVAAGRYREPGHSGEPGHRDQHRAMGATSPPAIRLLRAAGRDPEAAASR